MPSGKASLGGEIPSLPRYPGSFIITECSTGEKPTAQK
jgi:hypothetical protein